MQPRRHPVPRLRTLSASRAIHARRSVSSRRRDAPERCATPAYRVLDEGRGESLGLAHGSSSQPHQCSRKNACQPKRACLPSPILLRHQTAITPAAMKASDVCIRTAAPPSAGKSLRPRVCASAIRLPDARCLGKPRRISRRIHWQKSTRTPTLGTSAWARPAGSDPRQKASGRKRARGVPASSYL